MIEELFLNIRNYCLCIDICFYDVIIIFEIKFEIEL